ncbi:DUF3619 family protein [Ramlibacter rhizophilus]|uniref:DUF3619 family protein n=1 Tax=Ramlibacter rhizophilus TaxID=1781167 RepID=A0A4Z0C2M7_9BURK|nr:DUF3619 family protein [Ramlibacter rhizophilus]TFZ04720.1 DUF3619 family protein [Ramlibacter rhizophilus]
MNKQSTELSLAHTDALGRSLAARLSAGTEALPHDVRERLRAAREQALARRREVLASALPVRQARAAGGITGLGARALGLWGGVATALSGVALVSGLVAIHFLHNETRARQIAEVDAALLTDDLPPAAYADPGFLAFLRRND